MGRKAAWEALSSLFLDTDVAHERTWRAAQLQQCGLSVRELERILVWEVAPTCAPNLLNVAGVWTGFDTAWLEERILRRSWLEYVFCLTLSTCLMWAWWPEWKATREQITG